MIQPAECALLAALVGVLLPVQLAPHAVAAPNQHRLTDLKIEISNMRFEIGNPESAHPARLPSFRRSIALPLRPTQGCHKVAARAWLPMPPEGIRDVELLNS